MNDLTENLPPTDLRLSQTRFNENIPAGTGIGMFSSSDPDKQDRHSYKLINGKGDVDNKAFKISGNQLAIKSSPDFERQSTYNIRVQTTDAGGLSYSEAIVLQVNDLKVEGNAPSDDSSTKVYMKPSFASINNNVISLRFPSALAGGIPEMLRFRVAIDGENTELEDISSQPKNGMIFIKLLESPASEAIIKVSYLDSTGDQSSGIIEGPEGNYISSFTDFTVLNNIIDSEPPELVSASAAGRELILDFNELINQDESSWPMPGRFNVKVNNRKAKLLEVRKAVRDDSLMLVLVDELEFGDHVKLSYKDLKGDQLIGVLQDVNGNDMRTFSSVDLVNNTLEASMLDFVSALVDGPRLVLNFDREIAETKPKVGKFRVEVDGKKSKINSVDVLVDQNQVVVQLRKPVASEQIVKISYTDQKGNQSGKVVEDFNGHDLISFIQRPVDNATKALIPLKLEQAEMIEADKIRLAFNQKLNQTQPAASRFSIFANNRRYKIGSVEMEADDGYLILNLKKRVSAGEQISLAYKDRKGNQKRNVIEDSSGSDLKTITDIIVDNRLEVDSQAPILEECVFSNKAMTLLFNEELESGTIKKNRLKVSVDGKRYGISSIEVPKEDTVVNVVLRKNINSGADVWVRYKDPKKDQKGGVLEDPAGNDVESFSQYATEAIIGDDRPSLRTAAHDDTSPGVEDLSPWLEATGQLLLT